MDSGKDSSQAWSALAPSFEDARTQMAADWLQAFNEIANELTFVTSTWPCRCMEEGSEGTEVEVGSNVSATLLQYFSEHATAVIASWTRTYTIAGDAYLDDLRHSSSTWASWDFLIKFGQVSRLWASALERPLAPRPALTAASSSKWATAFETLGAGVRTCSVTYWHAFSRSAAGPEVLGLRAREVANIWAAEFVKLGVALGQAASWASISDSFDPNVWTSALKSIMAHMAEAAEAWASLFAHTFRANDLSSTAARWAAAWDEVTTAVSSFSEHPAAAANAPSEAAAEWAEMWLHFVEQASSVGRIFARQFGSSSHSDAETSKMHLSIQKASGEFEMLLDNLASRLVENGRQISKSGSAGAWMEAIDVLSAEADGTGHNSSIAAAFKQALQLSRPPSAWTDEEGWDSIHTSILRKKAMLFGDDDRL